MNAGPKATGILRPRNSGRTSAVTIAVTPRPEAMPRAVRSARLASQASRAGRRSGTRPARRPGLCRRRRGECQQPSAHDQGRQPRAPQPSRVISGRCRDRQDDGLERGEWGRRAGWAAGDLGVDDGQHRPADGQEPPRRPGPAGARAPRMSATDPTATARRAATHRGHHQPVTCGPGPARRSKAASSGLRETANAADTATSCQFADNAPL